MNQENRYLVYVSQDGHTVLVSYDSVSSLTKGQELIVGNSNEKYFLTLITFIDGVQEPQAVSESQWKLWEESHNV